MSDRRIEIGPVGDGQEFPTTNPARGRVFVHSDDPYPNAAVDGRFASRKAAIEAAQARVGASRSIDRSDDGPLPRTTRAEALLYSADLAPVVREVGSAYTALRRSMVQLSHLVNESRELRVEVGKDGTAETDDPVTARWQRAFEVLAPAYDALMHAYPEVAQIGLDAGRDERYEADVEETELVR